MARRPDACRTAALFVATLFALGPVAGCGGGGSVDGREAVSGSVTMNGAPLSDATIEFVPLDPNGASFGGTTIIGGEYRIPADKGLAPGEYKVVISMGGSAPAPPMDEPPGDSAAFAPPPDLIPAKYGAESILTATVEAGGANRFEFELQK